MIKACILQTDLISTVSKGICSTYNESNDDDTELRANENAIIKNRKELDNIMKLIKRGIFSHTIQETLEQLEEQKKNLEIENIKLKTTKRKNIEASIIENFLESFLLLDTSYEPNKELLINRFIRKVWIYKNKIKIELRPMDGTVTYEDHPDDDDNGNNGDSSDRQGNKAIIISPNGSFVSPSGPPVRFIMNS